MNVKMNEFKKGKILFDNDELYNEYETFEIIHKYSDKIFNDNNKYDNVVGISELDDKILIKMSDYNPFDYEIIEIQKD